MACRQPMYPKLRCMGGRGLNAQLRMQPAKGLLAVHKPAACASSGGGSGGSGGGNGGGGNSGGGGNNGGSGSGGGASGGASRHLGVATMTINGSQGDSEGKDSRPSKNVTNMSAWSALLFLVAIGFLMKKVRYT